MCDRKREPDDNRWHVGLTDAAASRAVWQDLTEMRVDLVAAIRSAREEGTLIGLGEFVLYWHYSEGETLETIADRLHLSYDEVRRIHTQSLRAIRETGRLESYET